MNRPCSRLLATGLALALLVGAPSLLCAEDKPPVPAGNGAKAPAPETPPAKPASPQDPAPAPAPAPPAGPGDPAGMVRFPGGKVKIGMSRKAMGELIKSTELARMTNLDRLIEDCYSLCTPEFEVVLPAFRVGKYEVTNAQWYRFLQSPEVRVDYVVPEKGKPGAATLDQIARMHLLAPEFEKAGGGKYYPVANDWKALYELNEAAINPVVAGQDPKTRPAAETFRDRTLPPGTKILTFRWSVPLTWRAKPGGPLQAAPPPWMEEMPATTVSYADAMAFAEYYGCHLPTEQEWEAACRGPKGEIWPEGGAAMDPLGHAWKGFNSELLKAQVDVKRQIAATQKRIADAKSAATIAESTEVLARLNWILNAREVPEDPVFTVVGNFPFGRSPCGAMDMIGNVEEWVSTGNYRYPNSDSKSQWADAEARILRGGNTICRDSLLTATFRGVLNPVIPLMGHMKFATAGFRVARYEAPGASAASHMVDVLKYSSPPILPREEEKGTRRIVGPDLDPYRAAGIERYNEVPWTVSGSPKNDPPGKVFYLGPAQSLCILPATGIPFRDPAAIKEAAAKNFAPPPAPDGAARADKRQPRDIPFLGLLHITGGIELKGDIRIEKEFDEPYTAKEMKALLDAWKAARKKKAEDEKPKEDPPKDGGAGGDTPPPPEKEPEKKMEGKSGGKGGAPKGGDPKGGTPKGGDKPPDGSPPPEGGTPAEDKPEPDEDEPKIPTTKKVKKTVHEQGFINGTKFDSGLLLGFIKVGEEPRAALWEPRIGAVGSTAPGGTVLLEPPLVVLAKDAIDFKKVGKPGAPVSELDATTGEVRLTFYIPVEGKDASVWIEVTLKLKTEYSSGWKGGPWVTTTPR